MPSALSGVHHQDTEMQRRESSRDLGSQAQQRQCELTLLEGGHSASLLTVDRKEVSRVGFEQETRRQGSVRGREADGRWNG